jgi:hypothetical protein
VAFPGFFFFVLDDWTTKMNHDSQFAVKRANKQTESLHYRGNVHALPEDTISTEQSALPLRSRKRPRHGDDEAVCLSSFHMCARYGSRADRSATFREVSNNVAISHKLARPKSGHGRDST